MQRVLGHILRDLDTKVKVTGHIMNFHVNAFPLKSLDVATSNYACA